MWLAANMLRLQPDFAANYTIIDSEEEPDNGNELNNSKKENRIVIRDIQWRSDSVSIIK